ncbi:hypothetical protein PsSCT_36490 [Pseudomonas sp. SCT]
MLMLGTHFVQQLVDLEPLAVSLEESFLKVTHGVSPLADTGTALRCLKLAEVTDDPNRPPKREAFYVGQHDSGRRGTGKHTSGRQSE